MKGELKHILVSILVSVLFAILANACGRNGIDAERIRGGTVKQEVDRMAGKQAQVSLDDIVEEIRALETPQSVDETIFQNLRSELISALSERYADRVVSMPPRGSGNSVDDLRASYVENDDTLRFEWSAKNVGDYNRDGWVNIQDITPLAEHFMERSQLDNEWIDGNDDGFINIQDITPIAENFFSQLSGYNLQVSQDGTAWRDVEFLPYSKELGTVFDKSIGTEDLRDEVYARVVPVDAAGEEGAGSNRVGIGFPVVQINANPTEGDVVLEVSVDISESSDPDGGGIVRADFDWNSDNWIDKILISGWTTLARFTEPGEYVSSVLVRDDEGFPSVAEFTVSAYPREWTHVYGGDLGDYGTAVLSDDAGTAYVVGVMTYSNPTNIDVGILKFNSWGDLEWAKAWGENGDPVSGRGYGELANAAILDSAGNLIVVGTADVFHVGENAPSPDAFILKISPEGNILWQKAWGYTREERFADEATDVAVDEEDNIYVSGRTDYQNNGFLLKYAPDGTMLFQKEIWGREIGDADTITSILLTAPSEMLIQVKHFNTVTRNSASLFVKLDRNGNTIGVKKFEVEGGLASVTVTDISGNAGGNIVVLTGVWGIRSAVPFIVGLDVDLDIVFQKTWGYAAYWETPYSASVTDIGDVWVASAGTGIFLLKTDLEGNFVFQREVESTGMQSAYANLSPQGALYVTGAAKDNTFNVTPQGTTWNDLNGAILTGGNFLLEDTDGTSMDIDLEYTDSEGIIDRENFSDASLEILVMKVDPDNL